MASNIKSLNQSTTNTIENLRSDVNINIEDRLQALIKNNALFETTRTFMNQRLEQAIQDMDAGLKETKRKIIDLSRQKADELAANVVSSHTFINKKIEKAMRDMDTSLEDTKRETNDLLRQKARELGEMMNHDMVKSLEEMKMETNELLSQKADELTTVVAVNTDRIRSKFQCCCKINCGTSL